MFDYVMNTPLTIIFIDCTGFFLKIIQQEEDSLSYFTKKILSFMPAVNFKPYFVKQPSSNNQYIAKIIVTGWRSLELLGTFIQIYLSDTCFMQRYYIGFQYIFASYYARKMRNTSRKNFSNCY